MTVPLIIDNPLPTRDLPDAIREIDRWSVDPADRNALLRRPLAFRIERTGTEDDQVRLHYIVGSLSRACDGLATANPWQMAYNRTDVVITIREGRASIVREMLEWLNAFERRLAGPNQGQIAS